jgi:copper(I)-binding protein
MTGIKQASVVLALGLLSAGSVAWAGVEVSGAWARATMPGQQVAGVYMQLRSDVPARLIGVKSSAAETAELHQMSNEGGVMKMRHVDSLDLPAGEPVTLRPGGYHVMLFDIKRPLKAGEQVSVTLVIEESGRRIELPVQAQVRSVLEEADPHAHHK